MFIEMNVNPSNKRTGDCVVRAISVTQDQEWDDVYLGIVLKGYEMKEMPSENAVWGHYLHDKGYSRHIIPDKCPNCYTIKDFVKDHPNGTYVLGTGKHAVACKNGAYYDTWDSGEEIPIYYWKKETNDA